MSEETGAPNRLDRERQHLLQRMHRMLDIPMLMLAIVWAALFVIEVVRGLSPFLQALGTAIWVLFGLEFVLGFTLSPRKIAYLRTNWLTAVSLLLPALRALRFVRLIRLARAASGLRGLRLLQAVSSANRGLRALGASMGRRGLGYLLASTLIVVFVGAAAMYAVEAGRSDQAFVNYGDALWWTAMIMTSMGSEYWPRTGAGRLLCFLLALYALAVFGYITAALATFFVSRDAEQQKGGLASEKAIQDLAQEVRELRQQLANDPTKTLSAKPARGQANPR